jgi:hypothetical protein
MNFRYIGRDPAIGERVWTDDISNVSDFFGYPGSEDIFYNASERPVGTVIREVREYIRELKAL